MTGKWRPSGEVAGSGVAVIMGSGEAAAQVGSVAAGRDVAGGGAGGGDGRLAIFRHRPPSHRQALRHDDFHLCVGDSRRWQSGADVEGRPRCDKRGGR